MANYTFANGIAGVAAFGQRDKIRFISTWVAGETWSVPFTASLTGNFTVGKGNIAGQAITCGLKLASRIYIGIGNSFAFSANNDVTGWEEQNIGAGVIPYLSQFGTQDTVQAFGSQQGRLAVFAKQSIQIWAVDADPANFASEQVLDNTGTSSPLSVKGLGDLDLLYLDYSGYRSLRATQQRLNSTINDLGTAIDLTVRAALVGYDANLACSIVEPTTKQYWGFLNGNIYVLSNYPESKIVAWSTYKATFAATQTPDSASYNAGGVCVYSALAAGTYYWTKGANETSFETTGTGAVVLTASGSFVVTDAFVVGTAHGTALAAYTGTLIRTDSPFTPVKFVIYNGQIYARGSDGYIYRYGGSNNNTYDRTQATVELPWLDLKMPSRVKQGMGLDAAFSGAWTFQCGMNPKTTTYTTVISRGSAASPSVVADSTFDTGHYPYSAQGTHIKIKAISGIAAESAKLGKIVFLFDALNMK